MALTKPIQPVEVIDDLSYFMYNAMEIGLEAAWLIVVEAQVAVAVVVGTSASTQPRQSSHDPDIGWC